MPANPHASPGGTGGPVVGGTDPTGHPLPPVVVAPPPPPPIDPNELRQREMLNEAVVNKWAVEIKGVVSTVQPDEPPPAAKPLEWYTVLWDVTMPTTVIPGVVPVLDLRIEPSQTFPDGPETVGDLSAAASLPRRQRYATSYALWIVAPKASRLLGMLTVDVDLSDAQQITATSGPVTSSSAYYEYPTSNITTLVFAKLNGAFTDGILTKQRPPVVDAHLESLSVDLALDINIHLPHWAFDTTATVGVTWDVYGRVPDPGSPLDADAMIVSSISTANTNIATGALLAILSADIAGLVAYVAENESDQFLYQLVGPLIAQDLVDKLVYEIQRWRPSNKWYLHHMDVDSANFTFWYCEKPASPTVGGGTPPGHPIS
jgi:hypothetical protein